MTLPSRRKHQTTVPNTHFQASLARKHRRRQFLLNLGFITLACTGAVDVVNAQSPQWQPSRLSGQQSAVHIQSLSDRTSEFSQTNSQRRISDTRKSSSSPESNPSANQSNPNVTFAFRFRPTKADSGTDASPAPAVHAASGSAALSRNSLRSADGFIEAKSRLTDNESTVQESNPLRSSTNVRLANYQQASSNHADHSQTVVGTQLPQFPQPQIPPANVPHADLPTLPTNPPQDALALPEAAPVPGLQLPKTVEPAPSRDTGDSHDPQKADTQQAAPTPSHSAPEDPSPFDQLRPKAPDKDSTDADKTAADDEPELAQPKRKRQTTTDNCLLQRERARNPLSEIDLNTNPIYGEGLRPKESESGKQIEDFLAKSPVREWADFRGNLLATGRMVDLKNDRIVLEENGGHRNIPLRDLSQFDRAFALRAWNLPIDCGSSDEPFIGRDHIASTFMWKAPGLCHKPLYFEEVQLERYGHEIGPVLQPLLSSAHFFTNIAILPYKMGINPMHECQYALGYYRPGDCVPYMIPPIPWSIPGAISQARVVVGGVALLP